LLVVGPNGVGKSNLLEAVELLGSLRSHRSINDQDLINWDKKKALLRAIANDSEIIQLELQRQGGRIAKRNEKLLSRQIDLIGPLLCVVFSAADLELVRGMPAIRRNWLDSVIQQLEPIYNDLTRRFNKILKQRSQFWRKTQNQIINDQELLLDAFDSQMALISTRILRRRRRALKHLEPLAANWQERLSKGKENLSFRYLPGSQIDGNEDEEPLRLSIESQLKEQREEEAKTGSCKVGPHRDEVILELNGLPARRFASAGQQRTIVLSLKLAELELIGEIYGEPPILLLDDVLAELDKTRQLLLLEAVGDSHQCLLTATHLELFQGEWQSDSQLLEADLINNS